MNLEPLISELAIKAIRSSGSGGQHVNKVSTKVELSFNISSSALLNDAQKLRLMLNLKNRLTKEGVLILKCGESRSQLKNKAIVTERFLKIIDQGLRVPKKRKPTKLPKSVKLKRLSNKRQHADKKAKRKPPKLD